MVETLCTNCRYTPCHVLQYDTFNPQSQNPRHLYACSKAQVDQYYDALHKAAVKRRGKAWKVGKIVQTLDSDDDGFVDTHEVKILFSRIFGVPPGDIPDDDEEGAPSLRLTIPFNAAYIVLTDITIPPCGGAQL